MCLSILQYNGGNSLSFKLTLPTVHTRVTQLLFLASYISIRLLILLSSLIIKIMILLNYPLTHIHKHTEHTHISKNTKYSICDNWLGFLGRYSGINKAILPVWFPSDITWVYTCWGDVLGCMCFFILWSLNWTREPQEDIQLGHMYEQQIKLLLDSP